MTLAPTIFEKLQNVGVGDDISLKIIDWLSDSAFQGFLKRDHHPPVLEELQKKR